MEPNGEDNIVSITVPKKDPPGPQDKDTDNVPQRQTSDEQPVVRLRSAVTRFSFSAFGLQSSGNPVCVRVFSGA